MRAAAGFGAGCMAVFVTGLTLATPVPAQVAAFGAFVSPALQSAEVDSTVTIRFEVDSTATHFNAYEVTIRYDPAILSFGSVQEGALMTAACPNRFKFTVTTDSTVTYSHSLLCSATTVDGPGVLSSFTFTAVGNGVSEVAPVSPVDCTFFDAGICVSPQHPTLPRQVVLQDGAVIIGPDPTGSPVPARTGPRLSFFPNPAPGRGRFRVDAPPGEAYLEAFDTAGRRVMRRRLEGGGGAIEMDWSPAARSGAPAGVYFARLVTSAGTATARIVVVR